MRSEDVRRRLCGVERMDRINGGSSKQLDKMPRRLRCGLVRQVRCCHLVVVLGMVKVLLQMSVVEKVQPRRSWRKRGAIRQFEIKATTPSGEIIEAGANP